MPSEFTSFIKFNWMIAMSVDASVVTDEVILDIGFNCDASPISTLSSVSKYDVSVE